MPLDGFLELKKGGKPVEGENLDTHFGRKHAMAIQSFWIGSSGSEGAKKAKKKEAGHGKPGAHEAPKPGAHEAPKPPPAPPPSADGEAAKPKHPLTFKVTKEVDLATTKLFTAYCEHADRDKLGGEKKGSDCFDSATVTLRKASGGKPLVYLVVEFTTVFVNSFEIKTDSSKLPVETVAFSFETCKFKYTPQKATGTGTDREITCNFKRS
jgi:type VI protein secretion system component Hcp